MPWGMNRSNLKRPVNAQSLAAIPYSRAYFQKGDGYDAGFAAIPDDVYAIGIFESEKYFIDFAEPIRRAYSFAPSLQELPLYAEISSNQSVAVHIRRGDKVESKTHRASDMNYVLSAVGIAEARIESPVFYVFSDDIPWCRKNLPSSIKGPLHFAENCSGTDPVLADMFLMSNCKHNIIGPSTFSWWAAWLNPNPGKIVVAPHPKLWGYDSSERSDLLPDSWIVVK
jgi:hypothetical protein